MGSLKCSHPLFSDVVLGPCLVSSPAPKALGGGSPTSVPHVGHFCDICALLGTGVQCWWPSFKCLGWSDETIFSSERNPDTGYQSTVTWWPVSYRVGYGSLLSARTELVFRALGRGGHPHSILRSRNSKKKCLPESMEP